MTSKWLGLCDYQNIFEQQKQSLQWDVNREEIWGLEHHSVITLGRRALPEHEIKDIPASILTSQERKIPVVAIDRGGLATVHNPGQLVIYPLFNLAARRMGPRDFICSLIKITRRTLLHYELRTVSDDDNSGLFYEGAKLCFLGVRITKGRSYHGLALNICNDLGEFHQIRSCGMDNRPLTSLGEIGLELRPEGVFKTWMQKAAEEWSW